MGGIMIADFIKWIIGLFTSTDTTPEIDKKIEDRKDTIKKLDEELDKEYNSVEEGMKEWEK